MCRNIKTLHNFRPPATDQEIRASALQFVRKLSGFARPSKANELAFERAVDQVAEAAHALLDSLVTNAPPRDRAVEAAKARARGAERFRDPLPDGCPDSSRGAGARGVRWSRIEPGHGPGPRSNSALDRTDAAAYLTRRLLN